MCVCIFVPLLQSLRPIRLSLYIILIKASDSLKAVGARRACRPVAPHAAQIFSQLVGPRRLDVRALRDVIPSAVLDMNLR